MEGGVPFDRRTLLGWLGKGAVLALGGEVLAACGAAHSSSAPAGEFPFAPGGSALPVFDRFGERTVDKQDLSAILASWSLRVDGLVEAPRTFRFAELVSLPRVDQTTDFHCVEGWSILDVPWNGLQLQSLIDLVRPSKAATHATFHTLRGAYNESLPLGVALEPRSLLAYGVAGSTLPLAHGFPLRVVVPRLQGYKNAKYVERIELTDLPVSGYWVQAGYPYNGEVPESRLRPGKY